jgi:predicted amidohydrolase
MWRIIQYLLISITILASHPLWAEMGASPAAAVNTVRVAAVSFVPEKFDLPGNANRLEQWFRRAQTGGAFLAVAPEGILDGYVVNEIIAGEESADKMREVAVTIDSPVIRRFQNLGRELEMCLVFGFAERIEANVFNCAVFIDHKGLIRGKYHKMQLAEGYDSSWWFNRLGEKSRAFDTPLGRCGILICNDRWNPLLARIPAMDGAQFLVIPAYGSRSNSQDEAVLSRSRESKVPIIEANVGVTLIANGSEIIAVDRQEAGITYADIIIPDQIEKNISERDRAEREFLSWRKVEMPRRLKEKMERIKKKKEKQN